MNFLYYGKENVEYEYINKKIIDGNVMNMSLITIEVNYGAIGADYSPCHGYYIINFSSSPYNLKSDLNIDGQVISYDEMLY